MMVQGDKTRSGLVAAKIVEANPTDGKTKPGGLEVQCMFNPYEYTISKTNNFEESPKNGPSAPVSQFKSAGAQTLKLKLYFDTYEEQTDVSLTTNKLWKFMEGKNDSDERKKVAPPAVAFSWGVFHFGSVIKSMTQKFTLFLRDGTPVRAEVNIQFVQHKDFNDYPKQNPTSGDGPVERSWQVRPGERLDLIAAEVYGDATQWPVIATYNRILNPHFLKNGSVLSIPEI